MKLSRVETAQPILASKHTIRSGRISLSVAGFDITDERLMQSRFCRSFFYKRGSGCHAISKLGTCDFPGNLKIPSSQLNFCFVANEQSSLFFGETW
jgi:hypothetical protein